MSRLLFSSGATQCIPEEAVEALEELSLEISELATDDDHDDNKRLQEIPREICEIIRSIEATSMDDMDLALTIADDILNEVIHTLYNSRRWGRRSFLPSFAETSEDGEAPLLKDTEAGELHFMGGSYVYYVSQQCDRRLFGECQIACESEVWSEVGDVNSVQQR